MRDRPFDPPDPSIVMAVRALQSWFGWLSCAIAGYESFLLVTCASQVSKWRGGEVEVVLWAMYIDPQ